MKKEILYRQCGLRRELSADIALTQVSFIPAKFAKLNHIVRLKDGEGQWEDGWKVVHVGTGVDADHLPDSHREIKAHRRMTGDSLARRAK